MKIATHSGHFHADELMAVAALLLKFPDAEVVRTRDEEAIKQADIAMYLSKKKGKNTYHFYKPDIVHA